jgi:small-conductance mechanosensitive channel
MTDFLYVIQGWLGMVARPAVLLQVLVIVALALGCRALLIQPRFRRVGCHRLLVRLGCLGALALAELLFLALGLVAGLIDIAAQLVLMTVLLELLRLLLRRFVEPAAVEHFWRMAVRPLFALLVVLVLIQRLDGLEQISGLPVLNLFGNQLTVGELTQLAFLPYFLVVWSVLPVAIAGWIGHRLVGISPSNRKAFELIVRYVLIGMGVLWIASQIGLNSTAITAIAGGLSVGLGFGVKEVISNFVSGIWLLFEGSVRPGDVLLYEGDPCEVRRLSLRAATLWRSTDNTELVIPNQTFFTSATTTFTGTDRLRRSTINVDVAYSHDPEVVLPLLEKIALANERVLRDPPPSVFLLDYGESAIVYSLRYYIADPMTNLGISSELRRAIWREFAAHGIEIPFPQRVLHQAPSA